MQQLLNVWNGLTFSRRMIAIAATVGMFLAIATMTRMVAAPSLTLLYAGLDSSAAGEVVRSLEARGVPFEVRGSSIFVASSQRDQLRMTLASEGLPANGAGGYELLDNLSGFGTTSQMFDAAYWRAKEGELARTIVSSPHISQARVHIANTGSNPFQRGFQPTASVAVTPSGQPLTGSQGKAIKFLVSSAVAGLAPDDVAVIGTDGALLGTGDEPTQGNIGDEKAALLKEKVERLLEARVGYGNAIVEVSVDTVTESEAIRERRFDPETRVAISTDTEEITNSATEAGGGQVSVASNLPDGDGNTGSDSSNSQNSQTRERINYEVSEIETEIIRSAGAVKRLTVAVLVNGTPSNDVENAETFTPRSEDELQALRELVSAAVGFDEARGDVITLKSMSLQTIAPTGTEASTSFLDGLHLDVMSVIQMAVLALVTLILGLFVVRPVIAGGTQNRSADSRPLPSPEALESDEGANTMELPALEANEDAGTALPDIGFGMEDGGLPSLPMFGDMEDIASSDPAERLRGMIDERQSETVEILRGWLEDREETA